MKIAGIAAGAAFFLYLLTLTPGLPPIDTGELIGCAVTFGIPHPTGYPVYLLLARMFALLPFAPVVGLSLLSAISVAAAVFLFARMLVDEAKESTFVVIPVALLLAGVSTVWNSAIRPEVYGVNITFLTGAFAFALAMKRRVARAELGFVAFSSLAAITHLSSGYFLLPLWIGILLDAECRKKLLRIELAAIVVVFATAHLILPLRANFGHPPYTWGDHATLDGWWRHVSGWQYRIWLFESAENWSLNFATFWRELPRNLGYIGLPLALYGWILQFRKHVLTGVWLTAVMAFPLVMICGYSIPDLDTYYLPVLLVIAYFAALALIDLTNRMRQAWLKWGAVCGVLAVVLVVNYPSESREEDRRQLLYANAILAQLPSPSLYVSADWEIGVGPLQGLLATGARHDVAVIDVELLRRSWYVESLFYRYPNIVKGCETELRELIPALRQFERKEDISGETLERLYRRAILVLIARNIPRMAVCVSPDINPPPKIGNIQIYSVALPLFSRLLFEETDYMADPNGLKIDGLFEEGADTRIGNRIRDALGTTLAQRSAFLFRRGYREEAFEFVRLAKHIRPPQSSHAWTILGLIEREQGRKY